jgi:hypothetical protein
MCLVPRADAASLQGIPGRIADGTTAAASYVAMQLGRAVRDPRLVVEWCKYAYHAVAHFLKHMWTGGRLLAKNVRIASGLMAKSALGRKLIRREETIPAAALPLTLWR